MKLLNDIIIFPYFSIPIDHKDLIRLHIFFNKIAQRFCGKFCREAGLWFARGSIRRNDGRVALVSLTE